MYDPAPTGWGQTQVNVGGVGVAHEGEGGAQGAAQRQLHLGQLAPHALLVGRKLLREQVAGELHGDGAASRPARASRRLRRMIMGGQVWVS